MGAKMKYNFMQEITVSAIMVIGTDTQGTVYRTVDLGPSLIQFYSAGAAVQVW